MKRSCVKFGFIVLTLPHRTGLTLVDQRRKVHMLSVIFIGFLWKTGVWVLPALLQKLKGWGVSLLVLRPYDTHCFKLVCMAVIPEQNASSKDDALCIIFRRGFVFFTASSLLKTSRLRTWIIGTMSFGLMRPR